MAQTGYNGGIQTVAPDQTAPDAFQRTQPVAAQALSGVGQDVSGLGESIFKTADVYSQAAVDNGFNDLQDTYTKLMYGDPGKKIAGPDGQEMEDTGYLGLKGRQALDARPAVEAKMNERIAAIKAGLATPEQEQAFETASRRYRSTALSTIGSHAEQQSNAWATNVNTATIKNTFDSVTRAPLDPHTMAAASADATKAYIQNAVLLGANPNDPNDPLIKDAISKARRGVLTAQVNAIGATDPSTALRILQKNKDIAGTDYDNLYTTLRTRAVAADGDSLAKSTIEKYAADGTPLVRVPGTGSEPAWIDTYLGNVKAQESGGDPNARSATSSATGLFQFIDSTWHGMMQRHPELGLTADGRKDPVQQEKAARAFTADNASALTQSRVPVTPGNLYLAAFFGAGGASHLYDLPSNTPMEQAMSGQVLQSNAWLRGKTVGDIRTWAAQKAGKGIDGAQGGVGGAPAEAPARPLVVDVGHPDVVAQTAPQMPSADPAVVQPLIPEVATAGTTPSGSASARASMIQDIMNSEAPQDVKDHAIANVKQYMADLQIAADSTAAQKKAANETAMNGYVTKMLTPSADLTGMQQQIAQDPNLTAESKLSLSTALTAHADRTVQGANAAYGPSFWDVRNRVLLPYGDPQRISDPNDVLKMAAPGPNGEAPLLTLDGAQKITTTMQDVRKDSGSEAMQKAKASIEAYAKSQLSNQRDSNPLTNDPGHPDPIGEAAFTGTFVPKFEAAFDKWVSDGKNPWEFLTKDNADKMMQGIRDPQEVAMQKILGGIPEYAGPAAPAGVDEKAWQGIVQHAPASFIGQNGQPTVDWPGILTTLASNPSPTAMHWFDQKYGKGNGFTAKDVLDALGVESGAAPAVPAAEAPPAAPAPNPDYPGAHAVVNGVEDLGLPMPGG